MKKRSQHWLILGSAFGLTVSAAAGLTTGILRYQQTQAWKINPYQNYDFTETKNSLLKAKIPADLVDQYLDLTKKITGITPTNDVIKADELLNLDQQMMNSISQRMIWNEESASEVQAAINLAKPILTQFYEHYHHVYVYQNDLINDSLNQMQIKSANTDLYKWSIGTNISDYKLIKDYLESAQAAWISKMKMSYIFETFLNQKANFYNSLVEQSNEAIIKVRQEVQSLIENQSEFLNAKNDAQDHLILISDFASSVEAWKKEITYWYIGLMTAYALQMGLVWWPPAYWALVVATFVVSYGYSKTEKNANNDLGLQIDNFQWWVKKIKLLTPALTLILKKAIAFILNKLAGALEKLLQIAGAMAKIITGLLGIALVTADYKLQIDMLDNVKLKIGNSDSEASLAIKDYINDIDIQINDASEAVNKLNVKENNYLKQKTSFKSKLNELLSDNKFFRNFNQMNDEKFVQTNIFTSEQIRDWQKEIEIEYNYLFENNVTSDDFYRAYNKEKIDFDNKYLNFQDKEKDFINNYNNNDKEYFWKNLLIYIENPLKNNWTYFNNLNFKWDNYNDIFEE